MELQEVLRLKRLINSYCALPPSPPRRLRRLSGLGGGTSSRRPGSPLAIGRPIALGASPGRRPNDYHLTAHLQSQDLIADEAFLGELTEMARGDVEILFVGEIHPASTPWYQGTHERPLIGSSVSGAGMKSGTIGLFTKDSKEQTLLLSNNHVLTHDNGITSTITIQAGTSDCKGVHRPIGQLLNCVPIVYSQEGSPNSQFNSVDAAVAILDPDIAPVMHHVPQVGPIKGIYRPTYAPLAVKKVGRTTGLSLGTIRGLELGPLWLTYPDGRQAAFFGQFSVVGTTERPFSGRGDSGSLILDADNCAVGLLFADSGHGPGNPLQVTYANYLTDVFEALNLPVDKGTFWA